MLRQILDAAEDAEVRADWAKVLTSNSLLEISNAAQRVVVYISRRVPGTLPGKDPKFAYVLLHITRKIVLARVSCRDAETKFDWSDVTLEDLRSMGPDEREWLAYLPEDWSAEDVGASMLGSRVASIFVPMLACLWADTVKLYVKPGSERAFVKDVQQSRCRNADFVRTWGHAPHPSTLMRDRSAASTPLVKEEEEQPVLRRPSSADKAKTLARPAGSSSLH